MSTDITDIKQLLANYCHRVDRGTPQEVAALFAPDAVLRPRYDGNYAVHGREAICGWYDHYNRHLRDGLRHLKHMIHSISISIEVDGDRASAVCYFSCCYIGNADGKAGLLYGTYTDTLARTARGWLFADRGIDTHIVIPGLAAVEQFPSMGYVPAGG